MGYKIFFIVTQVAFEEVIGEPDGAHSAECAWVCSYKCYEGGKNLCYKILTYICAAPLALCWGCQFACITFAHIWYITPSHRVCTIWCGTCQSFYHTFISCFLAPICETYGLVFSKIKVQNV